MKRIITAVFIGIVCFLFGCHQKNSKNSVSSEEVNCAAFQEKITKLINRKDSPIVVSQRIRNEYLQSSKECQLLVYQKAFEKLFFTAYSNPENDPDEENLHFLIQQGNENEDQLKIKLRGLFTSTGYYLYIKHDAENALQSLEKAKFYQDKFDDTLTQSYEALMAQSMLQKGNMQEAIIHLLNAISASEKLKDSSSIITNYGNLAVVYSEMGDESKAIPLMRKNLKYFLKNNNKDYAFIGYVGLANSFTNVGKIDSAVYCSGKALELIKNGLKNANVELTLYMNLGRLYVIQEDYAVARYYFNLAELTLEKTGSSSDKMIYEIYAGPAFAANKDMVQEIQNIKNHINYFYEKKDYVNVRNGRESLYRIANIKENYTDALEYYKQLDSVKILLSNKNNLEFISELQTKFETQKKEAKILSQKKEISKKNFYIKLLIILLLTGFLAGAFIITRNRLVRNLRKSKNQQKFTKRLLEKTEDERARIVKDLNNILSPQLLSLKQQTINNENIQPEVLDNIINEIRTISRNIHPVMLEQVGLGNSILHLCESMMAKEQIFITAEIDDLPPLTESQNLQIFRILQIIIKNILKHAAAVAAKIKLYQDDKKFIVLEVMDNGKGFNVSETLKNSTAFDLLDIIERSKSLNGKASFISSEKGTIVTIRIPLIAQKNLNKKIKN